MGHILIIILHKIVSLKLLAVLFLVTTVVMIFQLSTAFKVHALNVHTEIRADPPGIVRIIDRTGSLPAGITDPDDDSDTEPSEEPERIHRHLRAIDRHYREAVYTMRVNPIRVTPLSERSFQHNELDHHLNISDSVIQQLIQQGEGKNEL